MLRKNNHNNKILNNKFPLINMLGLMVTIYLAIVVNYWYFLLLPIVIVASIKIRPNKYQIFVCTGLILVWLVLVYFANSFSLLSLINNGLDKLTNNKIKESIFNFLDRSYGEEIGAFIKLILFNVKSETTYEFMKQTIDLGIVWLICVSGFHISLLTKIISKIFSKRKLIGKYVNISFIAIYSYLINFSYAAMRILLKFSLDWIFKHFKIQRYNRLGLIGIIICLLNPVCCQKVGFLLSFSICVVSYMVLDFGLNSKWINSILMSVFAFVVSIPFVVSMNHKISLLTFINSFVFSYFSAIVFIYFLIFAWMPFMKVIHYGIMVASYVTIGNISFGNIYIYSKTWPEYAQCLYFIALFIIYKLTYLIVYYNKI